MSNKKIFEFLVLFHLILSGCSFRRSLSGYEPILPKASKVAVVTYVYSFDQDRGITEFKEAPYEFDAIIENYLLQMGCQPVDRTLMSEIMKEQKLALTGAVKPEEAIQVGRLSGAPYILATLIRHDGEQTQSLATRLIEAQTAHVVSSTGMQMDEFKKRQKQYWREVFFRPRTAQ